MSDTLHRVCAASRAVDRQTGTRCPGEEVAVHVQEWLQTIPPISVYLLVGLVIGLESLGIPLPGEIILVGAALMSSQGHVSPWLVGAGASVGAIIGDSIGYAIGRRGGRPLLEKLGRRFPKHFSPGHVATAERSFERWGMWAVFFGRFIALLRIFAGPLSGVLRMPYWKFLTANVLGGITWAGGTTAVIYYVGLVAESWLKRFSWLGLIAALLVGVASFMVIRRRAAKAGAALPTEEDPVPVAAGD
jgi:membrane protein DedA with SNARE-associated domain